VCYLAIAPLEMCTVSVASLTEIGVCSASSCTTTSGALWCCPLVWVRQLRLMVLPLRRLPDASRCVLVLGSNTELHYALDVLVSVCIEAGKRPESLASCNAYRHIAHLHVQVVLVCWSGTVPQACTDQYTSTACTCS